MTVLTHFVFILHDYGKNEYHNYFDQYWGYLSLLFIGVGEKVFINVLSKWNKPHSIYFHSARDYEKTDVAILHLTAI